MCRKFYSYIYNLTIVCLIVSTSGATAFCDFSESRLLIIREKNLYGFINRAGHPEWQLLGGIIFVFLTIRIPLSAIYRHQERRADEFAARMTDPESFACSLEKIYELNLVRKKQGKFRSATLSHPALDKRVQMIRALKVEPPRD